MWFPPLRGDEKPSPLRWPSTRTVATERFFRLLEGRSGAGSSSHGRVPPGAWQCGRRPVPRFSRRGGAGPPPPRACTDCAPDPPRQCRERPWGRNAAKSAVASGCFLFLGAWLSDPVCRRVTSSFSSIWFRGTLASYFLFLRFGPGESGAYFLFFRLGVLPPFLGSRRLGGRGGSSFLFFRLRLLPPFSVPGPRSGLPPGCLVSCRRPVPRRCRRVASASFGLAPE